MCRAFMLLWWLSISAMCYGVALLNSHAQTTGGVQREQQRPRRVNTQSSPATSAPDATAPSDDAAISATATNEEVDEDDVVRVDTELVTVPVAVTTATGQTVSGLRAESFNVFEDNGAQRIASFSTAEQPFEVALLLDTSGSTRADVGLIRNAALAFIDALRPGDKVAVVAFSTTQNGATPLAGVQIKTALTGDRKALRQAIETVGAASGTPFYDSLVRVANGVFGAPPSPESKGRRAIVALTDGVDSSSTAEYAEARFALLQKGVVSYFIEINTEDFVEERLMNDCADTGTLRLSRTQLQRYRRIFIPRADAGDYTSFCALGQFQRMQISRTLYTLARQEMNSLATASGGKTFPTEDLRQARQAFAQVAAEIGTQYSLSYYPTNKMRDGRFRRIRVEVKGAARGYQIRAREGYYAPRG